MLNNFNCLINNNFKTLLYLYENKNKNNCVKITQAEVANDLNLSMMTIYKIFTELKNNNYIIQDKKHVGRYILTKNTIQLIKTLENLEQEE